MGGLISPYWACLWLLTSIMCGSVFAHARDATWASVCLEIHYFVLCVCVRWFYYDSNVLWQTDHTLLLTARRGGGAFSPPFSLSPSYDPSEELCASTYAKACFPEGTTPLLHPALSHLRLPHNLRRVCKAGMTEPTEIMCRRTNWAHDMILPSHCVHLGCKWFILLSYVLEILWRLVLLLIISLFVTA